MSDVRGAWNRACREVADWPGRPLGRLVRPNAYVLPLAAFPLRMLRQHGF
ncbi:hypothetical protein [Roseomonas mucosa]|nr:hypothetical protein [Roseomonas mucosa]